MSGQYQVTQRSGPQFSLILLCVHSGVPANIQLDIDGDRETERIYSLFNSYRSKLEKMQGGWSPRLSSGSHRLAQALHMSSQDIRRGDVCTMAHPGIRPD